MADEDWPDDPTEGDGDLPRGDPDRYSDDDLAGYETGLSRLANRARGWLALFVAVVLVVPIGGWLLQEIAFRRSGVEVTEQAGGEGLAGSVFLVRAARCDGSAGSGSGFVVQRDGAPVVVTNRHVVEGARIVSVRRITGGAAHDVARYGIGRDADVAVLELADASSLPAPLPFGGPAREGASVRVVGFPSARPFTTAGAVVGVEPHRLLLDVRTDPGASGSAVVDDDGRVVGQIFARTGDGRGLATPVGPLTDAIAAARLVRPGC